MPSWRSVPATITPIRSASAAASRKSWVTSSVGSVELGEQVLQLAAHDAARVRVQRRQRLVEQQHRRVARQRARERDALALAARQVRRLLAREVGDVEALEQLVDARRAAERDVRAHGHVRKERVLLEDEPDRARLGRQVDAGLRVEPRPLAERDPAAVGVRKSGHRAQHRRLAGPRRADERHGVALDGQLDVERKRPKAEGDVEVESLHETIIL